MNFSEAMFHKNFLTSDFHTNTVKMASKTVIRLIMRTFEFYVVVLSWKNMIKLNPLLVEPRKIQHRYVRSQRTAMVVVY